jgi:TolB-like protein/Tfp pilus assembly protein PilF
MLVYGLGVLAFVGALVLVLVREGRTVYGGSRATSAVGTRPRNHRPGSREPGDAKSVAVLPLVNVGGDSGQEYFSDGMTDELTSALAKIPGLRVAARSSAFTFKGRNTDAREVGEKLNVATVLEGSVRRSGPRLRVAAQLVSASDGLALWSETYERELKDVFQVQEEIAKAIAGALQLTLGGREALLAAEEPRSFAAHDAYLRGRFYFNRFTESDLRRSLELYGQALAEDSLYALAWAGIADAWSGLADDFLAPQEAYPKARTAAQRAIALEPTLADAHASLGLVLGSYDWDFAGAEREYQRAIALNPNAATAYHYYGIFLLSSPARFDSSLTVLRKAQLLDPLSPWTGEDLCWLLQMMGRYDEAIGQCRKVLELAPHAWRALDMTARALLLADRPGEALTTLNRAEDRPPLLRATTARALVALGRQAEARRVLWALEQEAERRYVRPEAIAAVHVALGAREAAFKWLDRAYRARSSDVTTLKVERHWDPIRTDSRFAALVKRVGIP